MKNQYERAKIDIVLLDERDIITASGGTGEGTNTGAGAIGGGGGDVGGWT